MSSQAPIPNERLRRARQVKGWSQAELAEQVGTSFEMVSRWERGITFPGPRYRRCLCEVLEQTAEELGLIRDVQQPKEHSATLLVAPASSHTTEPLVPPRPESDIIPEPPPLTLPTVPMHKQRGITRKAALLVCTTLLVLVGGLLSRLDVRSSLFAPNAHSPAPVITRGGTWTSNLNNDPGSLIPNAQLSHGTGSGDAASEIDAALYLPLFYGNAQGVIYAGAAREVPTLQNGGVNANATVWTFRLRPDLVWSDGQPYDARDVDYTWRLWLNPAFSATNTTGLNLISSADVSPDHLSITFHLKQPFAPFLADAWVDGINAPLPAHRFRSMTAADLLQSPDNLNPRVTSGPFLLSESVPGSQYTLIRNPRYYRAGAGLPYLDKVTFLVKRYSPDALLAQVQQGALDSTTYTSVPTSAVQKSSHVLISAPPTNASELLFFNFHNTILSTHLEVRQAIAMAVDQQTLVTTVLKGIANPLCTDHPSMYHPGYEPLPPCPLFDLDAARKLLDDNGWKQGPDGVRAKNGQRLEFEYSAALSVQVWRLDIEQVLQSNLRQIGIKIDIQNYPPDVFFGPFLLKAAASPPTGAMAGRYDIAEFANTLSYDPDDASLLACNQALPNPGFYCNHELDALYAQEAATADPTVRQEIFVQIHRIYLTDFPFVVLASPFLVVLSKKEGIHNFEPGPFVVNTNMWEWWCDQGKC